MFSVGLLGPMAQIAGDVLLISIILVVLAIYSPYVALCALLLFVPIFLLFHTLVRRRLREIGRRENVLQRAKTRIVTETYRGYADITSTSRIAMSAEVCEVKPRSSIRWRVVESAHCSLL